ncbi:hypothetical protein L6V77_17590 [Myxococcota bacterium]|nr:hypothetical protein [Myxococcota bacterium]
MGKAKGKTTGEDKAVEVGDDCLAGGRRWKRFPVHVADGGPIGAIWVRQWTDKEGHKVSIGGRFTGKVDMQDEFVFSPAKGVDDDPPEKLQWEFCGCLKSDATAGDIEIEIDFGIFKGDNLLGGRKANTNEWYVRPKILEKNNLTLRPVDDETLKVDTLKKVVLKRVGSAALVTKGQVSILEHGFETRPHPISTVWGGDIKYWTIKKGENGPFASVAIQNLDAFPNSLAFNQSFEVSPHVGVAARTNQTAEDPGTYRFFAADVFKPIASGTKVYFTHKVYAFDQNGSLHIGYFLDDTTAASPALKWYANTVIPYPAGGHVLNPYYGHRFVYAGGRKSLNLPAGYYAVTTRSVTYPG